MLNGVCLMTAYHRRITLVEQRPEFLTWATGKAPISMSTSSSVFSVHRDGASLAPRFASRLSLVLLVASVACVASCPARAQISLYSNYGPGSSYSLTGYGVGGPSTGNPTLAFEFSPTVTGVVTSMSAPISLVGSPSTVTAEILNDNGGLPGSTVLFSALGTAPASPAIVNFFSASGSTVTAGNEYWAAIVPTSTARDDWFENSIGVVLNEASSTTGGAYVSSGTGAPAFSVSGTIAPEPGSATFLTLSGIAIIGNMARKKVLKAPMAR